MEQLLAVAAVLGLLGAAVWALGRKQGLSLPRLVRPRPAPRLMKVEERLPLTGQHMLHLVHIGSRTLLVATHPSGAVFESGEHSFAGVMGLALDRDIASQSGGGQS